MNKNNIYKTDSKSCPEAIAVAKSGYMLKVSYEIKKDLRAQFISEVLEANILSLSREEPQNIYYDMYIPVDSDTSIHLVELWPSEEAIDFHKKSKHYEILTALKAKYDIKAEILKFNIDL
ncbi:MAG: putative quinol monooxygenase [Lachnospiraceae bacterium]